MSVDFKAMAELQKRKTAAMNEAVKQQLHAGLAVQQVSERRYALVKITCHSWTCLNDEGATPNSYLCNFRAKYLEDQDGVVLNKLKWGEAESIYKRLMNEFIAKLEKSQ